MDDRIDLVIADNAADQFPVGDIADDKLCLGRHRPLKPGRKAVENDDALARIKQFPDHVTADIAGAACHQNRHPCPRTSRFIGNCLKSRLVGKPAAGPYKIKNVRSVTLSQAQGIVLKQN